MQDVHRDGLDKPSRKQRTAGQLVRQGVTAEEAKKGRHEETKSHEYRDDEKSGSRGRKSVRERADGGDGIG